jgi:CBS domain-containing protein
MKVKNVMTPAPQCVGPDTPVKEAARQMRSLNVGVLPVCSNDRIVGMVTDRDLAMRTLAEECDIDQACVRDAMTPQVVYCFEDDEVQGAAQKMEERQVRRLPVVNKDKRLVGIVSLGDIATRVRDDRLSGEVLECVSEPSQTSA